jgi:O-antigen/teichoic acid export membrane protein
VLAETLGLGIELSKKTYLKLPAYIINVLVNFVSCIVLIPLLGILGAAIANALASISMLVARAVIGEHFYRCSDNYLKLILSMILLLVAGCVNYSCHTYIYLYVLVALSIVVYIYKKEVTIISRQGMAYINKRIKL